MKQTTARVKDTAKTVLDKLPDGTPRVAKAVGVAAGAIAAGITVVRAVRRRTGSSEEEAIFHLKQRDDRWVLEIDGEEAAKASFETKQEGLEAARELANQSAPCELIVYKTDGSVQDRHTYAN